MSEANNDIEIIEWKDITPGKIITTARPARDEDAAREPGFRRIKDSIVALTRRINEANAGKPALWFIASSKVKG